MYDHVWIFEARTPSTQPVRRRCGMCGVYHGIYSHNGPSQGATSSTANRPEGDPLHVWGGAAPFNASHAA
jgi:hypothetical protein